MAEAFEFFSNSPFRENITQLPKDFGDDEPIIKGNFGFQVDLRAFFKDYSSDYKEDLNYRDFDALDYHISFWDNNVIKQSYKEASKSLADRLIDQLYGRNFDPEKFLNYYEITHLSSRKGKVRIKPAVRIIPNSGSLLASYIISFVFKDEIVPEEGDEIVQITHVDGKQSSTDIGNRVVALEIKTTNYWAFEQFGNKYPFNYLASVKSKFHKAYYSLGGDEERRNIIFQCPRVFLVDVQLKTLYKSFQRMLRSDRSLTGVNSDLTMIKVLEVIVTKEGGLKFLYKMFNYNPWRLKTLYNSLDHDPKDDGDAANSTVLASLIATICAYDNQGINNSRDKRHYVFRNYGKYKVESNVYWEDSNENYFDIFQQEWRKILQPQTKYGGGIKHEWKNNFKKSLHPLDMVTLKVKNEKKKVVDLTVPAIFVKDIAALREWQEIYKAIRIGIDILIIILSPLALTAGSGAFFVALAFAEAGIAAADAGIQFYASEIRKIDGGAEFMDMWESFYISAGIVMGAVALPELILAGSKFLFTVKVLGKPKVYKPVKEMVRLSLKRSKHFPEFANDYFEVITNFGQFKGESRYFARKMHNELAPEGVLLIKGRKPNDKIDTYFLQYKGATLAEGSIQQLEEEIKAILKNIDGSLVNGLNWYKNMKTGTGGNLVYLNEFESTRMVCQELERSCGAACIVQIADHFGVGVSEKVARAKALFNDGIDPDNIGPALQQVLPNKTVDYGLPVMPGISFREYDKVAIALSNKGEPWIATIAPTKGSYHSVIVDKIDNGIVYIRDPWNPTKGFGARYGSEGTMELSRFVNYWKESFFHQVRVL